MYLINTNVDDKDWPEQILMHLKLKNEKGGKG